MVIRSVRLEIDRVFRPLCYLKIINMKNIYNTLEEIDRTGETGELYRFMGVRE